MVVKTVSWERQANVKNFSAAVESPGHPIYDSSRLWPAVSRPARQLQRSCFMKTVHALLLGVMVVASLGLWGCTQQQTGAITVKVRDLETRYAKLEEDYRALQSSNEQNKKRLAQSESLRATLEEQKTDLTKQLDTTTEQRDDLRKQV